RDDLQKEFEIKASPVEIKVDFKFSKFEDKVTYLHGRSAINNTFIDEFNSDFEATISKIFEEQGLTYNQGKNQNDLIKDIFSKQWSTINYILQYENDDFEQMSQGKKAFVILSLILEFSKDKKPVIIDQPEDSLDNRAIYRDLTNYLKKKKYERQIILVTHNPNVVVGADAENVIVANQHSVDSPNENENKFDYINGALENTGLNRSRFTLSKQGIREHVIEILEGGHEAFEKRELKYKTKKV
ncbi:AAA family ATPase, partial [Lactococcus garvieae]|uniref:AAA family ATPase n=1 Tax=Lactococcus garvieae TaxID=1363 RepID=UPI002549EF1F